MSSMLDLSGRVALVTGASGWLGSATARQLGACGAKVAVNYFSHSDKARDVVADIEQNSGTAFAVQADVTDAEQVGEMIDQIRQRYGPVDIVVNSAWQHPPHLKIEDQSWEDYLTQFAFCVKAPLLIMQAVLPEMKARKYGRIINIGSEAFELGHVEYGYYVAGKGAMLGVTRSWANELGPYNITVNLVAPGWIPPDRATAGEPEGIPLERYGVPADIASAVAFLASDEAGFITGQKLSVNGGHTLS